MEEFEIFPLYLLEFNSKHVRVILLSLSGKKKFSA